jgi:Sulfotransferase domain
MQAGEAIADSSIADNVTFVVGTGRCGSTVLSRILGEHPEVLSLNEFAGGALSSGDNMNWVSGMDGQEIWQIMSSPKPLIDSLLRDGLKIPEIVYPYDSGRFSPATGIPWICYFLLPGLTDDPDALYDRLGAEVRTWPRRDVADHCHALFGFLARMMGRRVVVERTGGSLSYTQKLRDEFPRARFVHMHRDGPDCALSMSRHPVFRYVGLLRAAAGEAGLPWPSPSEAIEESMPDHFAGIVTQPFDPSRYMDYPLSVAWFGKFWSQSTTWGTTALRKMPADLWTSMKFEDLLSEPEAELTRLAEFLGITPSPEWLAFARRQLDRSRAGTARASLDPDTFRDLQQACAPGSEIIRSMTASAGRGAGRADRVGSGPAGLPGGGTREHPTGGHAATDRQGAWRW